MGTVALEFVPPELDTAAEQVREQARKVKQLLDHHGIADRVNTLLIPGIIEEERDRPIPLKKRMNSLATWQTIRKDLPLKCVVTQVTAFHSENQLTERFRALRVAGIERAVCVGVPRTMADGEGSGVSPTEAVQRFKSEMPSLGVVLIPTRQGEHERFKYKLDKGADFALCQLLYSNRIVQFLHEMSKQTDHRPEILLSFGFVPKAETRVGLIRWLIKDKNPLVEQEIQYVAELAGKPLTQKKAELVDLYKRITGELQNLGFPLGIHLECPYGFTNPAFEVFQALLHTWSPR